MQSVDSNLRLANLFLDDLKVEKGLAPLSVAAYKSDLEQFSGFLLKRKRAPRDAKRQDLKDFLTSCCPMESMGGAWLGSSRRLRHFYKYLLLDRHIKTDPTLNIDRPRQWKVLPKSLAADEIESRSARATAGRG